MPSSLAVTGIGVISAIGHGKELFIRALLAGETAFGVMRRAGRQRDSAYIRAEIPDGAFSQNLSKQVQRAASLSAQAALVALQEAWQDARLAEVDPRRVGLVVGGSN